MFAAREYEQEIGFYNNRHRYLDPSRGAFTQEDLISFESGELNLYAYAGETPVVWADASGLVRGDWWDPRTYLVDLDAARKIADEVKRQAPLQGLPDVHNGLADAWRHARWNQRMVEEIGWGTAVIAGYGHEIDEMLSIKNHQPWNEFVMDLHNNRIGRDLAGTGLIPTEVKDELRTIKPKCSGKGGMY